MRTAPYGGAVQAPRKPAYSNPLRELPIINTRTCKDHMFLDTNLNKKLPQVSLLTNTQHPTGTLRARRHGNEMRPRDGGEPNARPQLLVGRRQTSPLPVNSAKIREQSEANHPGERDIRKRLRGGRTSESDCPPLLTKRQRPSP